MSMTLAPSTTITRVQKGVPSGGEFAPRARAEAEIDALGLAFTEVDEGLSAAQSKAFVEAHMSELDMEKELAGEADTDRERSERDARAHAHAVVAICAVDGASSDGIDARASDLESGRDKFAEQVENWDGPGEMTPQSRQEVLDFLRDREAAMFTAGEERRNGDAAAPFYAAAVVYADAADELSGDATQFTGGENL